MKTLAQSFSVAGRFAVASCCFLLALIAPLNLVAEELGESRKQLSEIETKIEQTLDGLRNKRLESGALNEDMQQLSVAMRRVERKVKTNSQQLSKLSAQIKSKKKAQRGLNDQLLLTEQQVRKRLVALYKTGEVGLLGILFSQAESPREIAEKYLFLTRAVQQDRDMLTQYRQQSDQYKKSLFDLERLQQKQTALVKQSRREKESLQGARRSKKKLLAALQHDQESMQGVLEDLRAKAVRLNDLVKKLETAQTQTYTETLNGLSARRGKLPWPVSGAVLVDFGASQDSELGTLIESHGLKIEASVGTPVRSVAAGKVIFANTLRGYGRLMIVDHGTKDYSLYAHMASFDKRVGDSVSDSEVIAHSGYEGRDFIYFEIRRGGKPLDPGPWLQPR
ncbi:MAG: peptidoglycan DD-metalloendopeptidase family protein [Desulfuromonadales bacterium]|nr:peptidoglycan DD-metalloendopeptidase family protein [Desulfuromonadales bacterium]